MFEVKKKKKKKKKKDMKNILKYVLSFRREACADGSEQFCSFGWLTFPLVLWRNASSETSDCTVDRHLGKPTLPRDSGSRVH